MINRDEEFDLRDYAEQGFLGALMHDPLSFDKIEGIVSPDDFISGANRVWFNKIKSMLDAGTPVDILLITNELLSDHPNKNWLHYIGEAMQASPSPANLVYHGKVVARHAANDRMKRVGIEISSTMSRDNVDQYERILIAEEHLSNISMIDEGKAQQQFTISEALKLSVEGVEKRYASSDQAAIEFPFGFDDLDDMTQGAHRGDVIYIAGRPSMGKTAIAMNFTESFCKKGHAGLVMSMEMTAVQLSDRMICGLGRIDAQRFRKGQLIDEDWGKLSYALGQINGYKLFIDEQSVVTPSIIRRSAKKAMREMGKLDFIVVDYMQLMTTDTKSQGNRTNDVSEISRQLKQIAKTLNVPMIVLSQLNRSLESRQNKRPIMSDLRESGAIEQDADVIAFLYRDEVYNPDTSDKGFAEIIIGKQRNGPVGTVKSIFKGEYSRFENYCEDKGY